MTKLLRAPSLMCDDCVNPEQLQETWIFLVLGTYFKLNCELSFQVMIYPITQQSTITLIDNLPVHINAANNTTDAAFTIDSHQCCQQYD